MSDSKIFWHSNAGIALAPILFIITILAVLVGALAASSGGFNSSSTMERNKTWGGSIIEQGANFKMAFERLYGGGNALTSIIISPLYTAVNGGQAFYSSVGGGLLPLNPISQAVPISGINTWRYVQTANLPGIGSAGANDAVIAIGISNANICRAINSIIFGVASAQATTVPVGVSPTITLTNDTGACSDVTMATTTAGCNIAGNQFDVSSITGINGRAQACIDDGTGTYYYYQLLLAQ